MSTQQFFLSGWCWDPLSLAMCGAVLVGYLWIKRGTEFLTKGSPQATSKWTRQAYGLSGLLTLVLALVSPIGKLARNYLFSAHMLQHLLLLLIVPPLLLLSLPRWDAKVGARGKTGVNVTPLTWLAGVGAMWFWHVPVFCNAATASAPIFSLQTFSLVLLGSLFWWPIVGPHREQHLSPLAGIGYLVSACLACTLLGIYVTFTPVSVCSIYAQPVDRLGILPLIQKQWGLTPLLDQHLGGLLMWVPACFIYLAGVIGLLVRWFSITEVTEGPYPLPDHGKGAKADA